MITQKRVALRHTFVEVSHKPQGASSSKSLWGFLSSAKSLVSSGRNLTNHAPNLELPFYSTQTQNEGLTTVEVVRDYAVQVPPPSDQGKQGMQIRTTSSYGVATQRYERWDSRTKKAPPTHQSYVKMTREGYDIQIQVNQLRLPEGDNALAADQLKACESEPVTEKALSIDSDATWCQEVSQLGSLLTASLEDQQTRIVIVNEDDLSPVYFRVEIAEHVPVSPVQGSPLTMTDRTVSRITLIPEQLPGFKLLQKLTLEVYFDPESKAFLGIRGPLRGIASDALIFKQ